MSTPTGPGLLPQQDVFVGHDGTSERSHEPINADAARAASGEKSNGKGHAKATPTPQALATAVHSVLVRIEYTELLLLNAQALDQHANVIQ